MERFQKAPLGNCFHVEGVDDCSGEQIFDERSEQLRIVVTVVQGAGAGKEIKAVPAVLTVESVLPDARLKTVSQVRQ